ncbi:MAG: hypothetical protein AB7S65_06215 [Sulfuricurvum sp.]
MAGVMFSFYNFASLVELNIGISNRLDENRSESFTILFCDCTHIADRSVEKSLPTLLRTSDSIVHYENYYFMVLPYTDRYGTGIVKRMFEESFGETIPSSAVCYPINGENASELFESLYAEAKKTHNLDLECLNHALTRTPS